MPGQQLAKQAAARPKGLEGLGGLLSQLGGGGGLLDELLAPRPTDASRGDDALGQISGSKDVSRTVANLASASAGLDSGLLEKILPLMTVAATDREAAPRNEKRHREPGGVEWHGPSGD